MSVTVRGKKELKATARKIDISVGQRIRQARLVSCLSQTELAEQLGVTFQQLQKYEHGINRVSAGRLAQIAHALNLPLLFFFDDGALELSATADCNDPLRQLGLTRDGIELARAYGAIHDPATRRALVEMARSVAALSDRPLATPQAA